MKAGRPTTSGYVDDMLVDAEAVAELIGVGIKSLYVYRTRGLLPEPAWMAGRAPVWWVSDIVEWDQRRKH